MPWRINKILAEVSAEIFCSATSEMTTKKRSSAEIYDRAEQEIESRKTLKKARLEDSAKEVAQHSAEKSYMASMKRSREEIDYSAKEDIESGKTLKKARLDDSVKEVVQHSAEKSYMASMKRGREEIYYSAMEDIESGKTLKKARLDDSAKEVVQHSAEKSYMASMKRSREEIYYSAKENIESGKTLKKARLEDLEESSKTLKKAHINLSTKEVAQGSVGESCKASRKRRREEIYYSAEEIAKSCAENQLKKRKTDAAAVGRTTNIPTTERVGAPLGPESFIYHTVIGQGGCGKVLLATHRDSGKLVAIKMVFKGLIMDCDPNLIYVERQVLEMAEGSPFCAHAYATFQTEDYMFYVMEYLSGGDLYYKRKTIDRGDLTTIRILAAELLCGLEFLHSNGVAHRDIKPDNIFIDGSGHVRIGDFGLSATNMFGSETVTGAVGTPIYWAPEVIRSEPYDTTADYFSLGILLYETVFGVHPFRGKSKEATIGNIICNKPRFWRGIDHDLANFLCRLLCKDQNRRKKAVANIRQHPFLDGVNWEEVEALKTLPPFAMQSSPMKITESVIKLEDLEEQMPDSDIDQRWFNGFSFVSDAWRAMQQAGCSQTHTG
ncbi:protein kinase C delta type-like [Rana temporaria]|uniref:protein kinase C delta type-like n=1 Tax=Rana temporaria TaxID=8407 RepID=UPI001AADA6B5|nr:protein kinase C delta type-like [Rana temporaria]